MTAASVKSLISFEDMPDTINVSQTIVKRAVNYLFTFMITQDGMTSFSIPLSGAYKAETLYGYYGSWSMGQIFACQIGGLDDTSIVSVCKLCTFDKYNDNRNFMCIPCYNDVNPNIDTVKYIRTKVKQTIKTYYNV